MPYQNMTNNYQISKYIVDSQLGATPYTTIQSAINQAISDGLYAGSVTIQIRPGVYPEDLTLYDGVNLSGCDSVTGTANTAIGSVTIVGNHTPPVQGTICFSNIFFAPVAGSVIASALAGTAAIAFENCVFNIPSGYIFNTPAWTGDLVINYCSEAPSSNAIITNSSSAALDIISSQIGSGSTAMTVSGPTRIYNSKIFCPIAFTSISATEIDSSLIDGAITVAGTSQLVVNNTYINSGSASAITQNSAADIQLNNVVINSSNIDALAGTTTIIIGFREVHLAELFVCKIKRCIGSFFF